MPKRKEENNTLIETNEVDKAASRPKTKKKKEESEAQKSRRELDYEYLEQAGKRITKEARKCRKQSEKKLSYNQAIALSALKG